MPAKRKNDPDRKPRSRQAAFNPEQAARVISTIAVTPKGLRSICNAEEMPSVAAVMAWLNEVPAFAEQYARAKQEQAELMAEDMLEIADDGRNDTFTTAEGKEIVDSDVIQRSKLRVDTRKWLMSKLLPKKYGDSMDVTSKGESIGQVPQVTLVMPTTFVARRGIIHDAN